MSISNTLLPYPVGADDARNAAEIEKTLCIIEKRDLLEVEWKDVQRLIRLLTTRRSLKYEDKVDLSSRSISLFLRLYEDCDLSIVNKSKALQMLTDLCRKKHVQYPSPITFNWKKMWNDAIDIISRSKKNGKYASDKLVGTWLSKLVGFLHLGRQFLTDADADEVADMAMKALSDTRFMTCVEGVLLLVTCLPTKFKRYDEMLPQWVAIWSGVTLNAQWDLCWLTLLTRARKHAKSFNWSSLAPLLPIKAKELMRIPTGSTGVKMQASEFPRVFPEYYTKMMTVQSNTSNFALNKLSKLMYFAAVVAPANGIGGAQNKIALTPSIPITPFIMNPESPGVAVAGASGFGGLVDAEGAFSYPGYNKEADVVSGVADIAMFFQTIRAFLYASNAGPWTQQIAFFVTTMVNEMSRHMARSMVSSLVDSSVAPSGPFSAPNHVMSMQYLCGCILSLSFEGIYTRDTMSSYLYSICLKALSGIDAKLGYAIVPFLMTALDASAVNRSHQAPIALQALGFVMKPLIYPTPVFFQFIPDLLKLCLPGIDPSDARKTAHALSVYSKILSYVPIMETYATTTSASLPPPYVLMMNRDDSKSQTSLRADVDDTALKMQFEDIAHAYAEWAPQFLERVFLLLEAQEARQKGQRENSIVSSISETVYYLFAGIQHPTLRAALEGKVINYFKKSIPTNAAKASAKIFEYMIAFNPSSLERVLEELLLDVTSAEQISGEKIAFRLRLAGGAVRQATAQVIVKNLPTLKTLIEPKFLHHSEKPVRKSALKLMKDIFKGSTSMYVTSGAELLASGPLGHPLILQKDTIRWHIPDAESAAVIVSLLEELGGSSISYLDTVSEKVVSSSSSAADELLSAKKIEEELVTHIKLLSRLLRGASEILGDDGLPTPLSEGGDGISTFEDDEYSPPPDSEKSDLLASHRNAVWSSISDDNAEVLKHFRFKVGRAMSKLHSSLDASFSVSKGYVTVGSPNGSPPPMSADSGNGAYTGLCDSISVRNQWTKLLAVLITRRMASGKNASEIKKWCSMANRMGRSMVPRTIQKEFNKMIESGKVITLSPAFSSRFEVSPALLEEMSNVAYWKYHDTNYNYLLNKPSVQHPMRLNELSFQATRACLHGDATSALYAKLMKQLVSLHMHEYDAVRNTAAKLYSMISKRYGWQYCKNMVLLPLVESLSSPLGSGATVSYARASAGATLVSSAIQKLTSSWDTTYTLLRALGAFPSSFITIPEVDKREAAMISVTGLLVKFSEYFNHLTLNPKQASEANELVSSALVNLNVDPKSGAALNGSAQTAVGLRQEMYAAYMALHFTGHDDVLQLPGTWGWAFGSLTSRGMNGSPVQQLALSALVRVVYKSKECGMDSMCEQYVASMLVAGSTSATEGFWQSLLHGVSSCHAQGDGQREQWTRGIAELLHSSEYMRYVFPRNLFARKSSSNHFSVALKREMVGLFWSMAFMSPDISKVLLTKEYVGTVLQASRDIPSSSEEENRANNATRAELFAGFYRAILTLLDADLNSEDVDVTALCDIEKLLADFLIDNVTKVSVEYTKDWAEGIFCATVGMRYDMTLTVPKFILDGFQAAIAASGIGSADGTAESDEGFSKNDKRILLTNALLVADSHEPAARTTKFGMASGDRYPHVSAIAGVLNGYLSTAASASIVPNYRSTREELSSTLGYLLRAHEDPGHFDYTQIVSSLVSGCGVSGSDSTVMSVDAENGTENGDETSSAANKTKSAMELACWWVDIIALGILPERFDPFIADLFEIALVGTGHPTEETARLCTEVCYYLCAVSKATLVTAASGSVSIDVSVLERLMTKLKGKATHASLNVRKIVMDCTTRLMAYNNSVLSNDVKKMCRDIFNEGMADSKPEVSMPAKFGMIAYLAAKPVSDLQTAAATYVKNCEILAQREKKKRKADSAAKPDKTYMPTINMCACMVMSFPFDMPSFMPALVSALVKNAGIPAAQDTVAKTLQTFKRTHQDRWEDFQKMFTRDELESLQGAGAQSYFS